MSSNIDKNTDKAIWYPIFSKNSFLLIVGVSMLTLFAIGLTFPNQFDEKSLHEEI